MGRFFAGTLLRARPSAHGVTKCLTAADSPIQPLRRARSHQKTNILYICQGRHHPLHLSRSALNHRRRRHLPVPMSKAGVSVRARWRRGTRKPRVRTRGVSLRAGHWRKGAPVFGVSVRVRWRREPGPRPLSPRGTSRRAASVLGPRPMPGGEA
jgi:hypothetical protein